MNMSAEALLQRYKNVEAAYIATTDSETEDTIAEILDRIWNAMDEGTREKARAAPPALSARPNEAELLLQAAIRAERKLSAYVGVCDGDKELTETVLPVLRTAIAKNEADAPRGQAVAPTNELLNAAMEAYYAKCGDCADAAGLCAALELAQKPSAPRIVVAELIKAARALIRSSDAVADSTNIGLMDEPIAYLTGVCNYTEQLLSCTNEDAPAMQADGVREKYREITSEDVQELYDYMERNNLNKSKRYALVSALKSIGAVVPQEGE